MKANRWDTAVIRGVRYNNENGTCEKPSKNLHDARLSRRHLVAEALLQFRTTTLSLSLSLSEDVFEKRSVLELIIQWKSCVKICEE